jgi:hypothetical protein
VDQDWPGSGSIFQPFRIEGLVFDTLLNGACVNISNTRSWFTLSDCLFNLTDFATGSVTLLNVSRGSIEQCTFQYGPTAVFAEDCDMLRLEMLQCFDAGVIGSRWFNSTISGCEFHFVPGDGISLYACNWIIVNHNSIESCAAYGLSMNDCHDSEVFNNTLWYNTDAQIFLGSGSSYNTIFDNVITGGAMDYGETNAWDAGIGHGNWWSDYSGSGYYYIPGSAGAVDHYPRGPAVVTTTTTTVTTTTTTTTGSTTTTEMTSIISSGIHIWTPISVPDRIALIVLVTASTALIAAALLLLLRKAKFV